MNRIVKCGLFAGALAALAAQPVLAQEQEREYAGAPDPKSYGYTVLMIGLATPVSLPWDFDWDVFGLNANFAYSDCNKMYGIEAAGVGDTARLDMIGLQAALGFCYANRDAIGAQVAAVTLCNRTAYGLTIDAFSMNRDFLGLRVDGLMSMTDRSRPWREQTRWRKSLNKAESESPFSPAAACKAATWRDSSTEATLTRYTQVANSTAT